MLDAVLSNNENRAWVFGENNPLRFDSRQVVAKTGTTNEFRDGWTVGYTPSLAVGVWAGNNDNSPMTEGADGVNVAAPIFRAFLDKTLTNYPIEEFPKYNPEDEIGDGEGKTNKPLLAGKVEMEEDLKVCEIPNKKDKYCLANKYCREDDVDKKDFVSDHDILHYVDRKDPRGPIPSEPNRDSQYKNWEKAVENWYEKQKDTVVADPPEDDCKESDFDEYKPKVTLSLPGSTSSSTLTLKVSTDAPYGVDKVVYFVDGNEVGSSNNKPYSYDYSIPDSKNNSSLDIKAELRDKNDNKATDNKEVDVSF